MQQQLGPTWFLKCRCVACFLGVCCTWTLAGRSTHMYHMQIQNKERKRRNRGEKRSSPCLPFFLQFARSPCTCYKLPERNISPYSVLFKSWGKSPVKVNSFGITQVVSSDGQQQEEGKSLTTSSKPWDEWPTNDDAVNDEQINELDFSEADKRE